MKRTTPVSKELFIKELETPAPARTKPGWATTLAIGEEAVKK